MPQPLKWQTPNSEFLTQHEAIANAPAGCRLPTMAEFLVRVSDDPELPQGAWGTSDTWFCERTKETMGMRVTIEESGFDQTDATSQDNMTECQAWYVRDWPYLDQAVCLLHQYHATCDGWGANCAEAHDCLFELDQILPLLTDAERVLYATHKQYVGAELY